MCCDQALRESEGDSEYSVEELIDMANQMVDETTKNMPKEGDEDPMDKGAWYSFHVFPVADAHAYVSRPLWPLSVEDVSYCG